MPSKSNSPAKKSKKTKAPKKPIPKTKRVKFIKGSTDVLVIAPHGVNVKGVDMDDDLTDIVAREISKELKCSALINDSIPRDERDYNRRKDAEADKAFIKHLCSVLDAKGPTLVLWIHGYQTKKQVALEDQLGLGKYEDLDCLIGVGQPGEDRRTAKEETEQRLIAVFKDQGISAHRSPHGAKPGSEYCGRSKEVMNQWCRLQSEYDNLDQIQSIQLEFKCPGFRDSPSHAQELGVKIANAIKIMVRPLDEFLVDTAYEHLKGIFSRHFHNAILEAGHYIINTFYEGNPRSALAKNKSTDQPPNLKKLIEKLRGASDSVDEDVPSMSWFYNAVNLAAHEAIAVELGLQTFGKLRHSHKLQLLHVPPLKSVKAEVLEAEIQPAFKLKERFAKHAIETKGGLSVREFKKHIEDQYPSNSIDLLALPPMVELRKMESKALAKLRDRTKKKIEESQKQIAAYNRSLTKLQKVLEIEKTK